MKQERSALGQRRWRRMLFFGGGLLILVLLMEGGRRIASVNAQARQLQNHNLELLQWLVRDSRHTSQDWAHWDNTLSFVRGHNPGFPARDMGTTALLTDGAVMAIFGEDGTRLAIAGGVAEDRLSNSLLSRCMRDVEQKRRQIGRSHIELICRGEQQLYVGTMETISDNNAEVVTQASLVYMVPVLSSQRQTPLARSMQQLQDELVLDPVTSSQMEPPRDIHPPLWTNGGQMARLVEPSAGSDIRQELQALAALGLVASLLLLSLRGQWMLAQRRMLLAQRRRDRLVNQRLRHSERQLEDLLNRIQGESRDDASGVFARLLQRRIAGKADDNAERQNQLAQRLEVVLEAARSLVLLDNLTGLPNRNFFLERLNWQNQQNHSKSEPLALLFINIDKFKQINETYGHRVGDEVIRHVASELQRLVSSDVFLARFGGDEFSLILNTGNLPTRNEAAIREHARQQALQLLEGFHRNAGRPSGDLGINLSIGIALSDPDGTSAEELVRRSDMAMGLAKAGRHDRISVFDITREIDSLSDYRLYNALQADVNHHQDRFSVLFQPLVSRSGDVQKLEALSRWSNPDFRDISPDVFFSIAERYRLIGQLGQLVLDRTFHEFKGLCVAFQRPDLKLALNISPSQLSQLNFGEVLLTRLERNDLSPSIITIEVTESAVVEASQEFTANLDLLRSAGMRLALDDFGTGFSSLRLLMWLKPDELKIDKSFVLAASRDPVARQIVQLLHGLANQMQLTLVAEGVEDQAAFDLLQEIGLDHFQGHLFCRAQSAEELLRTLRSQSTGLAP